jgi:hypothetical protein
MGALFLLACVVAQVAGGVQSEDPVQKAKSAIKQGESQLDQVRKGVRDENYNEALRVLEQYRDGVKSAHAALKASGRNAEKKPGGFKNLQIHLRHSLEQLDQMILTVPRDERAPFDAIRKELGLIDRELIDALSPRQPSKKSGDTAPGP